MWARFQISQIVRNISDVDDGLLRGKSHLNLDRDAKYSDGFRNLLVREGRWARKFYRFWCIWGFSVEDLSLSDRRLTGLDAKMRYFKVFLATAQYDRKRDCGLTRPVIRRCTRTPILVPL